jgi:hypothetical protein
LSPPPDVALAPGGGDKVLLRLMRLDAGASELLFGLWEELLAEAAPAVAAHFEAVGIMPQMYLIEWLFTIYVTALPPAMTAWVWDHVFVAGEQFLFAVALGIVKRLEPHLLALDNMLAAKLLKGVVEARMQFESGHEAAEYDSLGLWSDYCKTITKLQVPHKRWSAFCLGVKDAQQ